MEYAGGLAIIGERHTPQETLAVTQEWITVGALGDAFLPENNCLRPVADLARLTLTLHFENGWIIEYHFTSECSLSWKMVEGEDSSSTQGEETYTATNPRSGIYFVDFIKRDKRATSVSFVLDFENSVFLALVAQLPTKEQAYIPPLERIERRLELTAVSGSFLRGTIDKPFSPSAKIPAPTCDLIGRRIEYRYSPTELYEHIYLNDRFYTWRCIEGSEQGLTDTDTCHYYKIGPDLYLFAWREKLVPTLGVVMLDLSSMKTTGKIFGYETNAFRQVRNFGVGARVKVVAVIP